MNILGGEKDYFETQRKKDPNCLHINRHSKQIYDEEGQQSYHWIVQAEIRCDEDEPHQRNHMEEGPHVRLVLMNIYDLVEIILLNLVLFKIFKFSLWHSFRNKLQFFLLINLKL